MKIRLANRIDENGLKLFSDKYEVDEDVKDEDGILVRSANLLEEKFPSSLLTIARAGAGVNNIPLDRCSEEGTVVFNTPDAQRQPRVPQGHRRRR